MNRIILLTLVGALGLSFFSDLSAYYTRINGKKTLVVVCQELKVPAGVKKPAITTGELQRRLKKIGAELQNLTWFNMLGASGRYRILKAYKAALEGAHKELAMQGRMGMPH